MNINSVYCAKIYRLINKVSKTDDFFNVTFKSSFSKETLVYQNYDLLTEKTKV